LTKDFAVTEPPAPIFRLPLLVSAPAMVSDPPPPPCITPTLTDPLLTSEPFVDTEAPSRESAAPAPIEASPVRALFDPSAVLSSIKPPL